MATFLIKKTQEFGLTKLWHAHNVPK